MAVSFVSLCHFSWVVVSIVALRCASQSIYYYNNERQKVAGFLKILENSGRFWKKAGPTTPLDVVSL